MNASTFLLIVVALRNAKLALFDSRFALLVFGCEILNAVLWNRWELSVVLIVQAFAMLSTVTIVLYNTRNEKLRMIALSTRFVALAAAQAYYFSSESHWFQPRMSVPSCVLLAVLCALTATVVIRSWYYWRIAENKRDAVILTQTVVPAMKQLASFAPFSPQVNIALWCCCNSLAEEVFSRLILYESLISTGISVEFALLVQAFDFGMLHLHHGFPFGSSGFALSALFGVAQGALYIATGGLLVPWLVHATIDYCIFTQIAM